MIIYEALYNYCIFESAFQTISLHLSKEGAEEAIETHKKNKLQYLRETLAESFKKDGYSEKEIEKELEEYMDMRVWTVSETEVLP